MTDCLIVRRIHIGFLSSDLFEDTGRSKRESQLRSPEGVGAGFHLPDSKPLKASHLSSIYFDNRPIPRIRTVFIRMAECRTAKRTGNPSTSAENEAETERQTRRFIYRDPQISNSQTSSLVLSAVANNIS